MVSRYDGGYVGSADRSLEMQVGMVVLFATGGQTARRAIGVILVDRSGGVDVWPAPVVVLAGLTDIDCEPGSE